MGTGIGRLKYLPHQHLCILGPLPRLWLCRCLCMSVLGRYVPMLVRNKPLLLLLLLYCHAGLFSHVSSRVQLHDPCNPATRRTRYTGTFRDVQGHYEHNCSTQASLFGPDVSHGTRISVYNHSRPTQQAASVRIHCRQIRTLGAASVQNAPNRAGMSTIAIRTVVSRRHD